VCAWFGSYWERLPSACPLCGADPRSFGSGGLRTFAVRQCRDWKGCPVREHSGDPAYDRCVHCGVERELEFFTIKGFCDGCTNYGAL
jgi:hypothetical protein